MQSAAHTTQAMRRRESSGNGATPEPVQMAQNDGAFGALGETQVYAIVNPSPSPNTVASWAPIPAGAPVATPQPWQGSQGQTPPPSPAPGILTLLPQNSSGVITLSGSVPIPGAPQTVSPIVYVFPMIPLACQPSNVQDPNSAQGVSFQNGKAVTVSTPAQADLYIDGPHCSGAFANANETVSTLHVPGGFARWSLNSQSFLDITTSAWVNTATSIDWPTLQSTLSDATTAQQLWEAQTTSGHFVRFFLQAFGGGGDSTQSGAAIDSLVYDQSGFSLTGSY